MGRKKKEIKLVINTYRDLLTCYGCAACYHRHRGACRHPKLSANHQLKGNIFYYVENSCHPSATEVRPVWCPLKPHEMKLPSEEKSND